MSEFEPMHEKKDSFTAFQSKYNVKSKSLVQRIATNLAVYICILLPFLLVGFIWTDFGTPTISLKLISEGIITVAMLVIGESMMMRVGTTGGKLDEDYLRSKDELALVTEEANKIGTMLMPIFCEWQTDIELDQAITTRLRPLRFTREDWEKVKTMSFSQLKKTYGKKKAIKIAAINKLQPVDINESILLYDSKDGLARGGIPMSGDSYLNKKMRSPSTILACIFTGLLTISVAMYMTTDIGLARVIYTLFKLIVLLYRMGVGYALGAKAYNTVEVRRLKARTNYLRRYCTFVADKIYLNIGSKYGDPTTFTGEAKEAAEPQPASETPSTETPAQAKAVA